MRIVVIVIAAVLITGGLIGANWLGETVEEKYARLCPHGYYVIQARGYCLDEKRNPYFIDDQGRRLPPLSER